MDRSKPREDSKKWKKFSENSDNIVERGKQLKVEHHQQREIERILKSKFIQSNGKLCDVFSAVKIDGLQRYNCKLCSTNNLLIPKLLLHANSETHRHQLQFNAKKFASTISNMDSHLKPECHRQQNEINNEGIVGVEYVIEIYIGDWSDSNYHCVLCEARFDLQAAENHMTTYVHRFKYLEKHFPTAFEMITSLESREKKYSAMEMVCKNIEQSYGQLKMSIVKSIDFYSDSYRYFDDVSNGKHFDEKMGRTFEELFVQSNTRSPASDGMTSTCSSASASTSSEFDASPYNAAESVLLSKSPSLSPKNKILPPISPPVDLDEFRRLEQKPQLFKILNDPTSTKNTFKNAGNSSSQIGSGNKQHTHRIPASAANSGIEMRAPYNRDRSRSPQRQSYLVADSIETKKDEDGPVTIISVLSVLSAFENLLGILGPELIRMLTDAITMEKKGVKSSIHLLDDKEYYNLFEAINEKLKELLRADIFDIEKKYTVRKTIAKMNILIDEANTRNKLHIPPQFAKSHAATETSPVVPLPTAQKFDRNAIADKVLLALHQQGRADISEQELAQYVDQYIVMAIDKENVAKGLKSSEPDRIGTAHRKNVDVSVSATDSIKTENGDEMKTNPFIRKNHPNTSVELHPSVEPTTLTDSNLRTLIKNFNILSDEEKHEVIVNIREIESNDPERLQRLRKDMHIDNLLKTANNHWQ